MFRMMVFAAQLACSIETLSRLDIFRFWVAQFFSKFLLFALGQLHVDLKGGLNPLRGVYVSDLDKTGWFMLRYRNMGKVSEEDFEAYFAELAKHRSDLRSSVRLDIMDTRREVQNLRREKTNPLSKKSGWSHRQPVLPAPVYACH